MRSVFIWGVLALFNYSCDGISGDTKSPIQSEEKTQINSGAEASGQFKSNETSRMVEELKNLVNNESADPNTYRNRDLAVYYLQRMQDTSLSPKETRRYWFNYCRQLLFSGQNKTCLTELTKAFGRSTFPYKEALNEVTKPVFELLALTYLRLGEQENCLLNHSAQSCIIPIKENGIHQLKEGSEKAIQIYELLQERFPSLTYKWILNIAHMTLGTYPEQVPPSYLLNIPSRTEQSNFIEFKDISMQLGLAQDGLAGSVCLDDFNNDGYIDIFMTSSGIEDNVQLFINNQNGGFSNTTIEAGLQGIVGGFNCVQADYDNDGNMDILVLRGAWLGKSGKHPNSLLKNMGDGTFRDVTRSSKLLSYHPTQTASWADFNNDGNLDLFIGNESKKGNIHPCELFRNNGNGTFSEVAEDYGLAFPGFVKSVSWGDINNDGWLDLYVSRLGGENFLFRNDKGYFTEISKEAGVNKPIQSFPCWFWDINNDGFDDLLVLTYDLTSPPAEQYVLELSGKNFKAETPKLYINNRDGSFSELASEYGLEKSLMSMGANFGDLDNDGNFDFYVGTGAPRFTAIVPNRMFRNVDGKRFEEVTSSGNFGHIQKGHGIAFADLDNDGDQDIYAVMGGFYQGDNFTNVLYENPISKNNWIVIKLLGKTTNRNAVGVKVELKLNDGRKLYRRVSTGGSFGANPLHLEIGLGKADNIEQLTIFWPQKEKQTFQAIDVNQKILIEEGSSNISLMDYTPTPFNLLSNNHHHE